MDPPVPPGAARAKRHGISRAFRPVVLWLLASMALLTWDFNRKTTVTFTVWSPVNFVGQVSATLDGQPFAAGQQVSVGKHALRLTSPDMEPFETNRWIWFGLNDLGQFEMAPSTGELSVETTPPALAVSLQGPRFETELLSSHLARTNIPTGQYTLTVDFGDYKDTRSIQILRQLHTPVAVEAPLGWLEVASAQPHTRFTLTHAERGRIRIGQLPLAATLFPTGSYTLTATRGGHDKAFQLELLKQRTNHIEVAFEYGQIQVDATPEAAIAINGSPRGQTPFRSSEMPPGRYDIRLKRDGFSPVEWSVSLSAGESVTLQTNLINLEFAQIMIEARRWSQNPNPDFERVLALLARAEKITPNHPEVAALTATARAGSAEQSQRAARREEQAAIETRKTQAKANFAEQTIKERDSHLFDTLFLTFNASVDQVRDGVRKTMTGKGFEWTVYNERRDDPRTCWMEAADKGLLRKFRRLRLLISEVAPNEVHVYAKFWDYGVAKNNLTITLGGISEDSLVPIHPQHFPNAAARIGALHKLFEQQLRTEVSQR